MNFTLSPQSMNYHRNPMGLKGSSFASLIVKPELVRVSNNNHHNNNNNHLHGNHNNSNSNNGANSFLTISKSRVPDIQMINKYYGLVPKKFVINARSDYSSAPGSTKLRARTAMMKAQSFDEESYYNGSTAFTTERILLPKSSNNTNNNHNTTVSKAKEKKCHDDDDDSQAHNFSNNTNMSTTRSSSRRSSISNTSGEEETREKSHSHHHHNNSNMNSIPNSDVEEQELVARKMSVEKQHNKKWRRGRHINSSREICRSLSMMDEEEFFLMDSLHDDPSEGIGGDKRRKNVVGKSEVQRVIKIDLNNMRWEESYQSKARDKTEGSPVANISSSEGKNKGTKSPPREISTNNTPAPATSLKGTNNNASLTNGGSNNNSNAKDGVGENPPNAPAVKRGVLRKTISFDEQLVRSTSDNSGGTTTATTTVNSKQDNKESESALSKPPVRRPVTASARTSISSMIALSSGNLPPLPQVPCSQSSASSSSATSANSSSVLPTPPAGKVQPWTNRAGQNTADRRAKFQKSFSVYSESMDGCGESDNEQDLSTTNPQSSSSTSTSSSTLSAQSKFRESRKSLHVQPPPEISTMISLMSPPPVEEDLQAEMEKVTLVLNAVQSKISMSMEKVEEDFRGRAKEEEQDKEKGQDDQGEKENEEVKTKTNDDTNEKNFQDSILATSQNQKDENTSKVPLDETTLQSHALHSININVNNTNGSRRGRKTLQKAASISCEAELDHVDEFSCQSKTEAGTKHGRPQTSRAKTSSVSFSNTTSTRLIPPRSFSTTPTVPCTLTSKTMCKENAGNSHSLSFGVSSAATAEGQQSQSQASKNRKILIKKALIEINQSSINVGKKINHTRPKTAPIPDKKPTSFAANNNNNNSHHHQHKRQPLKARSPSSVKTPTISRKNFTLSSKMEAANSSKETCSTHPADGENEPEKATVPIVPTQTIHTSKVRGISRQSSFAENLLGGFLSSDLHTADEGLVSVEGRAEGEMLLSNQEVATSFINSKKREECLKIYEKMMKKGCSVKLETIFRAMMTPYEYRMQLEATEMAEKNSITSEIETNDGDAGVSSVVTSQESVST